MNPQPAISEGRRKGAIKPAGRRALLLFFGALALIVAGGIATGLLPRLARQRALAAASSAEAERLPMVDTAAVKLAPGQSELELPGDLQALIVSPIFARVDGYLKTRLVDVGDRVRAGQLLGEIETPELDEQIRQSQATVQQSQDNLRQMQAALEQARANLKLAEVTRNRWKVLADRGVFARQEYDEKQAAYDVQGAAVNAALANIASAQNAIQANQASLRRLEQMKSFARLTAPFDGVVTDRNNNVDPGTLISAGSGGNSRELFRVAQTGTLRIFVNVPQTYVNAVHTGELADLRVQELPGQVFPARVVRLADSLDANSRSMLTVLEVLNPRGLLKPGMYAQVGFRSLRAGQVMRLPADTLIMSKQGPEVAVVENGGVVHIHSVHIARDLGTELEITSGVEPGQRAVMNPSDLTREGSKVRLR